jgi:predicted nucleic acid-binding protein
VNRQALPLSDGEARARCARAAAQPSDGWVYADETTDDLRAVFEVIVDAEAHVPGLWRLEVANVLEMGVRRGRHDAAFRDAVLADLAELPIRLDPETDAHAWGQTMRLAARHRLTLYDAAYLELAMRRELPLASLDGDLCAAARAEGVVLALEAG